jgi:ABC-type nitrate/sulfonate/bicarbonate transport system substrate-binding protein
MTCPMTQILGILFTTVLLSVPVQAMDKIRIAYPGPGAQFIPLQLAQSKGFLKDDGLDAEFIRMAGNLPSSALVNGDIDYSAAVAVWATLLGLPLRVVACYVPSSPVALIARPEFKSVRELKGKPIGVQSFGGALNVQINMILRHFGLDPERDVKFIVTREVTSRLAAMKQGLIAATAGAPPSDQLGMKMGFVVLAKAHELFNYPNSGLVTTMKKIKERPDEIKKVIKAGIRANNYIRTNREGTIQFLMSQQKIDREIAAATYDSVHKAFNEDGSVPEDGLRLVIEEAKKSVKVDRQVSVSDVADLSMLREAQKELGIKAK